MESEKPMCLRPRKLDNCSFFSSIAADLALRLGPDSERNGRIVCKKYDTLWLHKRGKPWKNENDRKKYGNSDDTHQHRKQRTNTKRGRSHTNKGLLGHDGDKPTVSPICTNKLTVYGPNTLKGEKLSCEKQQQGLLKATVHNGSHLRVLSGALCLS